jgi:hypothetical protein
MKRVQSLVPAAVLLTLALALTSAGSSRASGHSSRLASRVGRSDVDKLSAARADSRRWLEDDRDWDHEYEHHRELRELAWRASAGALDVDGGQNGGVIVTGWGRDSIRVVARVQAQAKSQERADELARGVRIVNENGKLSADGPDTGEDESWSVTFDVLAPRTKTLHLDAENGPVCVADMEAQMELGTVNGPMVLSAVAGDVRARTENGPLTVSLTGNHWRGAGLDASTENGPVMLAVPRGYNCQLETGTVNGPMRLNIDLVTQGRIEVSHQRISAKMGSGGPRVRAITTNGPAVVSYSAAKGEGDEVEN